MSMPQRSGGRCLVHADVDGPRTCTKFAAEEAISNAQPTRQLGSFHWMLCSVVTLEDNDLVHMVRGSYAIFNMAEPSRPREVERVHEVPPPPPLPLSELLHDHR